MEYEVFKNDIHDNDYVKRIEFEPFCRIIDINN